MADQTDAECQKQARARLEDAVFRALEAGVDRQTIEDDVLAVLDSEDSGR